MKIICVGRNYIDHAKELNNTVPKEPVLFLKPQTAIIPKRHPFFIPDHSNDIHHEAELVVKINRLGKHIDQQFAHKYYNEVTVGIDFTARDVQTELKKKGLPWEIAKAFDGSAALGSFKKLSELGDINNLDFALIKNDQIAQKGNTKEMLFKVNELIAYISKFFTLKIGDLIFTGTPAGVSSVQENDRINLTLQDHKILTLNVK